MKFYTYRAVCECGQYITIIFDHTYCAVWWNLNEKINENTRNYRQKYVDIVNIYKQN